MLRKYHLRNKRTSPSLLGSFLKPTSYVIIDQLAKNAMTEAGLVRIVKRIN